MKTSFKNALKSDDGKSGTYPFDFKSPAYDERSSCYMQAGKNHGVGHRQPVGTEKHSSASVIPKGVHTKSLYDEKIKYS